MSRLFLTATLSVFLLLTLTGCGLFGQNKPSTYLPPLPSDLVVCFDSTSQMPTTGPIRKSEVIDLIADLRASELEKTLCGRRLISFYETLLQTPA